MSWIEIRLKIPAEKIEDISGYLFAQGCEGIHLTDEGITIYFSQFSWSDETRLALLDYIRHIVPAFSNRNMRIVAIADQDWNRNWKEFFKPVYLTDRVVVKPPWEKWRTKKGEIVIIINPKMAFGTGQHESTQLVARALDEWQKAGMHVLDIGTGSGILAILAEKLGAETVIAIDNDPLAIKNSHENARLNKSSGNIRFYLGQPENLQPSEYDIVMANINRNVLLRYVEIFPDFVKADGKLIVSGIILSDESAILGAYEKAGFRLLKKNAAKEWLSLIFERRQTKSKRRDRTEKAISAESRGEQKDLPDATPVTLTNFIEWLKDENNL